MSSYSSTSRVETDKPARYMAQLCKHFAHKIPAQYGEQTGNIEFAYGTCFLEAEGDRLLLRVECGEADALDRLEDVVAKHLVRFMWREKPEIVWSRAA